MNVIVKETLIDFSCTWSTNYKYPCSERIFVRNLGQNKFGFASFVLKETSLVEMCELSNSSSANASELFESSHISTREVSNQTPLSKGKYLTLKFPPLRVGNFKVKYFPLLKGVWPKFPKQDQRSRVSDPK